MEGLSIDLSNIEKFKNYINEYFKNYIDYVKKQKEEETDEKFKNYYSGQLFALETALEKINYEINEFLIEEE